MTKKTESNSLNLPPKPKEPNPGECCGRNCENCVYVYYERAVRRWEKKVEAIKLGKSILNQLQVAGSMI